MGPTRKAIVGYGISDRDLTVSPIELRAARSGATLFLFAAYTLDLDEQDESFLTVDKSSYRLQTSERESVVSYDFVRNPSNDYPEAHLQIRGECFSLGELAKRGSENRSSSKLHLPVGGRRFRPCLEDIIEFCVVEGLVLPHSPDWKEVVDAKREQFYRRQLKAAVRQQPEEAVSVLERLGFSVFYPEDEQSR